MPASHERDDLLPASPPTECAPNKRDLATWWKQFTRGTLRRDEEKALYMPPPSMGIFGVPLQTSIRYANVAISLYDDEGRSYIYGYVPIVVAKCGVFLKEKATDVEGIFRLSGSEKRIKELRTIFDSPDRYGKGLDWSDYTVHDAANVLRRYFNQLPEPIIPLEFYSAFRDPLRAHFASLPPVNPEHRLVIQFDDEDQIIDTYQKLIVQLPPLNRQLLLYILDLLAVFASKSDLNKMTTSNLAAIFQPGTLFHPKHNMAPDEYRLNQFVLIFLIEKQDHFLIGMQGTAADEKTMQEVESGPPTPACNGGAAAGAAATTPKLVLGRSSSVSSMGGESVRRVASLRRNQSVSSRLSGLSSPSTPIGSGVHRSNTLPRRSPRVSVDRPADDIPTPQPTSPIVSAAAPLNGLNGVDGAPVRSVSDQTRPAATAVFTAPSLASVPAPSPVPVAPASAPIPPLSPGRSQVPPTASLTVPKSPDGRRSRPVPDNGSSTMSRLVSSVLPTNNSRDNSRQPNKLRKFRAPSVQSSDHSSTQSLYGAPIPVPYAGHSSSAVVSPALASCSPPTRSPHHAGLDPSAVPDAVLEASRSASSITDMSEPEHGSKGTTSSNDGDKDRGTRRWRKIFKPEQGRDRTDRQPPSPKPAFGSRQQMQSVQSVLSTDSPDLGVPLANAAAPGANPATIGAGIGPATAPMAIPSPVPPPALVPTTMPPPPFPIQNPVGDPPRLAPMSSSAEADEKEKARRGGLIGRVRDKLHDLKEDRKEREAEKARNKSPEGRRFEVLGGSAVSSTSKLPGPDPFMSMNSLSASLNGIGLASASSSALAHPNAVNSRPSPMASQSAIGTVAASRPSNRPSLPRGHSTDTSFPNPPEPVAGTPTDPAVLTNNQTVTAPSPASAAVPAPGRMSCDAPVTQSQ